MFNKRGQGLSTNAIILIVLGVIVLVVLMLGFTVGWSKFAPWIVSDNVGSIVQQCDVACGSSNVYDFCSRGRELKADDLPGGVKEVSGNCTYFATDAGLEKYGVPDCPGLCD